MSMADGRPCTSSPEEHEIVRLLPALRAFARTFFRDADSADDLVQETLMKGLANIHQFRPGTSMKSWLFTIMRNAFYTRARLSRRELPGSADSVSVRPARDPPQESSARARETAAAIQTLPPDQREMILLIGVRGVSYDEASSICGCAMGTVRSRLSRARLRLLKELQEESIVSSLQASDDYPVASLPKRSA